MVGVTQRMPESVYRRGLRPDARAGGFDIRIVAADEQSAANRPVRTLPSDVDRVDLDGIAVGAAGADPGPAAGDGPAIRDVQRALAPDPHFEAAIDGPGRTLTVHRDDTDPVVAVADIAGAAGDAGPSRDVERAVAG